MKIPQVSPWLGEDETTAVMQVISNNWITEGPRSEEFTARLLALMGAPYGVLAPNGTLALVMGLMALGIQSGDEVLVPDITFIGSANAVIMLGAIPIFVDVERVTFQIDLSRAARHVTSRTKAIMPVHLYGTACNMQAVGEFAALHHLQVIEDAAQGIGVQYRGVAVGALGDVGCFSFFADKTITTGEGGLVICKTLETYQRLLLLRNQGRFDRGSFIHPAIGYNFRITDLQAAIGLVQLAKLNEIVQRKQAILSWYRAELENLPALRILGAEPGSNHVPFRCVLITEYSAALSEYLETRGIQIRGFFYPLHRQPCFVDWAKTVAYPPSLEDSDYPNANHGYENGVCLPIFPTLTKEQVAYIGGHVRAFFVGGGNQTSLLK